MRVLQGTEELTIPRGVAGPALRVSDMVRNMVPRLRNSLSDPERRVGIHLRGNEDLFHGLRDLIESRIGVRVNLPVPSDPIQCKAFLERDRELLWLLSRLELIFSSPVAQSADNSDEQPG